MSSARTKGLAAEAEAAALAVVNARQAVEDVAAQAARAVEDAAAAEQRILDGDEDVKPGEVETASGLVNFWGLRRQAAERKAERAAAQARAATIELLADRARGNDHLLTEAGERYDAAAQALRDVVALVGRYEQGRMATWSEARRLRAGSDPADRVTLLVGGRPVVGAHPLEERTVAVDGEALAELVPARVVAEITRVVTTGAAAQQPSLRDRLRPAGADPS